MFCFFVSASLLSQSKTCSEYINFEQPVSLGKLQNNGLLEKTKTIHFSAVQTSENLELALNAIKSVSSIESIIIADFNDHRIPKDLAQCKYIRQITFLNCKDINIKDIMKLLSQLPAIEVINLGNCRITVLPSEIKGCTQLRQLNISLNSTLNLSNTIEVLAQCKNLESLSLPVNQLSEIPSNISKLNQLKELNLANNNITDLPESIRDLDSLESITLQKNIIFSPVSTYQKLNKQNIKYLSIDAVSDDELAELERLFPNAKIVQADAPDIDLLEMHKGFKDSIHSQIINDRISEKSASEIIVEHVGTKGVKVASMAYLHYAKLFDPLSKKDEFRDTLLFDDRFQDTNYYNIFRRQQGLNYDGFYLKRFRKSIDNQIWFYFDVTTYFYSNFYEYLAFKDLVWAVVGNQMSIKEFNQKWIKNIQYTDFRLSYQSEHKNFLLTLKTNSGFQSLTVVPRHTQKNQLLSSVQSSYEIRYVKYLEELNKRRRTFNKSQYENAIAYRVKTNKMHQKNWDDFTKLYFSNEEKDWTQEQWLVYYDEVISNEKKALLNSEINEPFFTRILKVSNYIEIKTLDDLKRSYGEEPCLFNITNDKGEPLTITKLFVINHQDKSFKKYSGSNAPMDFYLFVPQTIETSLVAVLRNGDFAVAEQINTKTKDIPIKNVRTVLYQKEFTELGDLLNVLKIM